MTPQSILNFVEKIDINTLIQGIVLYMFIIWFCIVVWVAKDISNRTQSLLLQIFSILMVLFLTPLGIFIYLLIRPQKTLFEKIFEEEFMKLDSEYKVEVEKDKKILPKESTMDIQKIKHLKK